MTDVRIEIRKEVFEPYREVAAYQKILAITGKAGATCVFVGTMRDFNEGSSVRGMTLEHYPGMTEKHLHEIAAQAGERWRVLDCLILHRVGEIRIDDAIVLVAVWSAHRGDAMDACRYIIEDLKSRAPFWKKEQLDDGERWVDSNTTGYSE